MLSRYSCSSIIVRYSNALLAPQVTVSKLQCSRWISIHTESHNIKEYAGQSDAASSLSSTLSDGLKAGSRTSIRSSIITWSIRAAPTPAAACAAPRPLHSTKMMIASSSLAAAGQLSRWRLTELTQICSCSVSSASHAGRQVLAPTRQNLDTPSLQLVVLACTVSAVQVGPATARPLLQRPPCCLGHTTLPAPGGAEVSV